MPVNFLEIRDQIAKKSVRAREREVHLHELIKQAGQLLQENSERVDWIRQRVEKASSLISGLRCAAPVHEPLTQTRSPQEVKAPYVILAADGSQVNPSRHDQVEFGVINVGTIRMLPGQHDVPREAIRSELLCLDDLLTPDDHPVGEEIVALRRDLYERRFLAELAATEKIPVVALTDGPLELFREPRDDSQFIKKEYSRYLGEYLKTLEALADMNAVVGGYVDKPKSDLVVRMLELLDLQDDKLDQAGGKRRFPGVTDASLFFSRLKPGERSAVFSIQSPSMEKFKGKLGLHFFYLNAGYMNHHSLARVEIPAWVAGDENLLNLLHTALVTQCRQMGTRPYPYIINRAHEIALVSFDEKQKLNDMIVSEWHQQGVEVGEISNKQAGKEALGSRKRFQI